MQHHKECTVYIPLNWNTLSTLVSLRLALNKILSDLIWMGSIEDAMSCRAHRLLVCHFVTFYVLLLRHILTL
jgi:hypothetical protein